MSKQEVINWLNELVDDCTIHIDDDGMRLIQVMNGQETGNYLEIGGFTPAGGAL